MFVRLDQHRELHLEIFDAAGRKLIETGAEDVSGGAYLHWDGRTTTGELATAGVYYVAVRGPGVPAVEPIKVHILR